MGCFSFNCKVSGKPAASSSFPDGSDAVYLFLLKDGKVIEEMHGKYDSYGRVFDNAGESYHWNMDWSDVCDLIFNDNEGDGIALVLACNFDGTIPTTQSTDDPDQGWGKKNNGGFKMKDAYHKVLGVRQDDETQVLIDKVIAQIKKDIQDGDLTAVDELLKFVPKENLIAFLSE